MSGTYWVTVLLASAALASAASRPAQGQLLFADNFNKTGGFDFDVNPNGADAPGRQTGSVAPLDYNEDPAHVHPGGARDNMTQVNNPDFPNAVLLAPSTDIGFEGSVIIQPDHDFAAHDPGVGHMMVISYDANPVHDASGVQVTDDAPILATFAQGLAFLLHDGGDFAFFGDIGLNGAGDLAPGDTGGIGGSFAGFHTVRIELITDAWVIGEALNVRVFVDNNPVPIDTDATPTVYESTVKDAGGGSPENFITLTGRSDPTAPGRLGGFTVFTLHGIDNLSVSIAEDPLGFAVPAVSGWGLLVMALLLLTVIAVALRRQGRLVG